MYGSMGIFGGVLGLLCAVGWHIKVVCRVYNCTERAMRCPSQLHHKALSMGHVHSCHVVDACSTARHVMVYCQQYIIEPRQYRNHVSTLSERARPPLTFLSTVLKSLNQHGHFASRFKVNGEVWSMLGRSGLIEPTMWFMQPKPEPCVGGLGNSMYACNRASHDACVYLTHIASVLQIMESVHAPHAYCPPPPKGEGVTFPGLYIRGPEK